MESPPRCLEGTLDSDALSLGPITTATCSTLKRIFGGIDDDIIVMILNFEMCCLILAASLIQWWALIILLFFRHFFSGLDC